MSGILDSKQRIMDTIVTLEGRKQIADGKLKVEYVSFTDGTTFYSPDLIDGSADATNRLYFEQCHLPQDQITFEADDSGKLKPFKNSQNIEVVGGKIFAPTIKESEIAGNSSARSYEIIVGGEFVSSASTLIKSSVENFQNLYLIGTNDALFLEDENFEVNPKAVNLYLTNQGPVTLASEYEKSLNNMPSIFEDKQFSNVINFKYLPPINKIQNKDVDRTDVESTALYQIGNYARLGTYVEYTTFHLENELASLEKKGHKKTFTFDPTSFKNMLVSQAFELLEDELLKLDVLEYGTYKYEGVNKQVYFVGKVLVDDYGTNTFIRLFTLVFE
jgi:hypothetical protein